MVKDPIATQIVYSTDAAACDPNASADVKYPSKEELGRAIQKMVTLETIAGLTRRIVRQKLESEFVLAENSLLARKKEIDQIVEEVVANLQTDGEGTGDGSNTTPNDVKPGQKRGAGRSNGKRSHESEDAEDFSDDSSDTEEAIEKSSGSAVTAAGATGKRAVGFRKAQASIMTRTYFIENAKPLESNLGPIEFTAQPREFKTGSCGWFFNCKRELDVGGTSVHCQVTVNCTVLGSKSWKARKKGR